jgi:Tol biopolymer transport system component
VTGFALLGPTAPLNVCVSDQNFDLFVLDPAAADLRNLTQSLPLAFDFAWTPDGEKIAVDLIPQDQVRRSIDLIDIDTGAVETLAHIEEYGDLPLEGWSPSGTRLLFGYNGGRGACENIGAPGAPTPPPTTLELLTP